jgi:multidrug efflux system outer membrane protein
MRPVRTLAALAVAALLAACATPETNKPALDLPAATAQAPAGLDRWWTLFNDAQLTALIEEALANNLDLRTAVARIDEARANLQLARSALFPSLDVTASSNRAKRSEATALRQGPPFTSTTHDLGLAAAYEVDLWGKLRSGRNAADASLLATRYDVQTVRIALAAQVATTYFSLRAFDAELALTKATLATRDENVRLQQRRREAGVASEYEFAQAEAERAAVAAAVPPLERAVAQTEAALAALAGRSARAVYAPQVARGVDLEKFDPGPEVPAGLPSDLLARRPDVRRAEAALVAADARIAEARAQYFPSLTLTASLGGESAELSDLLTSPARVWSIAAGLVQPIIGAKRIGAQVDAATARREQAALGYQQAVQAAFRDVHDALVAQRSARAALTAQEERRAKLAEALRLAELRYRGGYSSYLEVLDAQRGLLSAERERIAALRDRQAALVDLYKALGGGWSADGIASR